jgi:hypothetical protein
MLPNKVLAILRDLSSSAEMKFLSFLDVIQKASTCAVQATFGNPLFR